MLKTLLVGATIGVIGKILYDDGKFAPYLALAKEKIDEIILRKEANDVVGKSAR